MKIKMYFGTDGIRGEVGKPPITPDFVLRLGWAFGRVVLSKESGPRRRQVVIGKDTRVSGYMLESALEAGLVAAGVDVKLLGPMPTPAVATLTQSLDADGGIVISASHNQYSDNGLKFFGADGEKISDEDEFAIEAELSREFSTVSSNILGKASRVDDAPRSYIEFCKSTVSEDLDLNGIRIALDCANGATYHVAPKVFSELGADLFCLGVDPDGFNINLNVGSTCISTLAKTVKSSAFDLGIAFDGDGDRVLFVDSEGNLVDGDQLLYLLAIDRLSSGGRGGVVGTQMSNFGLEKALADLEIDFCRAQVGDRHVKKMMRERGWILGGESSGHIICGDVTTTGDGIVAALQILRSLNRSGAGLFSNLISMQKHPQHLINLALKPDFDLEDARIVEEIKMVDQKLGSSGRVLLRPSGTEPVLRVMIEALDQEIAKNCCQQLAQKIREIIF